MTGLYRDAGIEIYEGAHYSHGEHINEVNEILTWCRPGNMRVLDIGCGGGLHALEFAKRGFSVTGLDIEPSVIELAKKRNGMNMQKAKFRVLDIEKDGLFPGKFDFIYSLGNVLSHVKKDNLPDALLKIKGCLVENGTFLFDVLINARPFQGEICPGKNDIQIIWKRKIDKNTGRMSMDGIFLEYDFVQHFDVWGYTIEEIKDMLDSSGFREIDFSEKLDFTEKVRNKNPVSLYIRAKG